MPAVTVFSNAENSPFPNVKVKEDAMSSQSKEGEKHDVCKLPKKRKFVLAEEEKGDGQSKDFILPT